MTKAERKQIIRDANEAFGRPFVIFAADEVSNYSTSNGSKGFYIQTPGDERMFIDYASSKRNWVARDAQVGQKGGPKPGIVTTAGYERVS